MEINPATFTGVKAPSQNLIDPTKITEFSEPPGFWKALILDCLSVASALFFGYSYFRYLTDGFSLWFTGSALLIFSILSVLQVFLTKEVKQRSLIILAESFVMVVPFIFYDDWHVPLIAGLVVFIALLWGYLGSKAEAENEVEIHFFKTTRNVLGKVTTAAILFFLIVYAPQAQGQGIFIPRSSFRTLFTWTASSLRSFYPGVAFGGTFGDFASSFVKAELSNNPTFNTLDPAAQTVAVDQGAKQLSGSVKQATGIAPLPNEPVSDVAYDYTVAMLANWKNQFKDQFLIVWVIALFLIFRTIGFIFVWIMQLISLAVYELLIASGFMHIDGIPQTKEVVKY